MNVCATRDELRLSRSVCVLVLNTLINSVLVFKVKPWCFWSSLTDCDRIVFHSEALKMMKYSSRLSFFVLWFVLFLLVLFSVHSLLIFLFSFFKNHLFIQFIYSVFSSFCFSLFRILWLFCLFFTLFTLSFVLLLFFSCSYLFFHSYVYFFGSFSVC